jgi:trehalose-6-phosphate synthase
MNLLSIVFLYLTFERLSSVEKKGLLLTRKIVNNKKGVLSVFHSSRKRQEVYKNMARRITKNAGYILNLFTHFDYEDPVHFYMLIW